ncbi:DASH complex subunit dad2 [Taxawa tesnikishii (nom. ined.)]|nr:DASH complex subunit dad2 [Dothideales sp. JES 119]
MEQLEEKLATLADGTEAVAAVLSNWHNVLRAIHMASAKIPRPKDEDGEAETPLPQTLVRIPIQQAEEAQNAQESNHDESGIR